MKFPLFFAFATFSAFWIGFITGYIVRYMREAQDAAMDWLDRKGGSA